MGRLPRPIADSLVYHVVNRGNNRADVFGDDSDRSAFLEALAKTQAKYPFRLYGYCLMTNHVHLLLRPEAGQSISRIMQSLTIAHTLRYHRRHRSVGHVWQGRFKSPPIEDGGHLLVVLRYIEANPLRAKMVSNLGDYPWSSYPAHGQGKPDSLLSVVPEWEDLGRTPAERQARWRRRLASTQPKSELTAARDSVRTGRPLGSEKWVAKTAHRLGIDLTPRPRGRPKKTAD